MSQSRSIFENRTDLFAKPCFAVWSLGIVNQIGGVWEGKKWVSQNRLQGRLLAFAARRRNDPSQGGGRPVRSRQPPGDDRVGRRFGVAKVDVGRGNSDYLDDAPTYLSERSSLYGRFTLLGMATLGQE